MSLPALVVIDVQKAIDDPVWGSDRNNRDAEANMSRLLVHWRKMNAVIIHVRHVSVEPDSTYRPGQAGAEFKPEVIPMEGEVVLEKSTNSAFIGTPLQRLLEEKEVRSIVICGVITNNSVEATARMSGNLGFDTIVVSDATATFGRRDYKGTWRSADEVHAMSLANLEGEYARVMGTEELLGM
jgi:nicotinamidase-related amidase